VDKKEKINKKKKRGKGIKMNAVKKVLYELTKIINM